MSSYNLQQQSAPPAAGYPAPPTSYPPKSHAYVSPPPAGYPIKNGPANAQQAFVETKSRGDKGFWKGCCAALCCCCVLETCF